jgi:hypothetical protein
VGQFRGVIAALALLLSTSAAADTGDKLAIVPLDGLGVDAVLLDKLDKAVRDEVNDLGVRAASAKAKNDCSGDVKCLAGLGEAAGADQVLAGSVGLAGDVVHITLRIITVKLASEYKSLDDDAPADQAERHLRATAMKLLAPDQYVTAGSIVVATPLEGAVVFVDGQERGRAPFFSPIGGIAPGRREVEVKYPGTTSWRGFIDVSFDEAARLDVVEKDGALVEVAHGSVKMQQQSSSSPPPAKLGAGPSALTWFGVGAGALGLAALVGAAIANGVANDAFAKTTRPLPAPDAFDAIRANRAGVGAYYALISVGILGLAAGGGLVAYSFVE